MHSHRSNLKQHNKPFKGKSKGKVKALNRGRIEARDARPFVKAPKLDNGARKTNRFNTNLQIKKTKRAEAMLMKRLGSAGRASRIVALVALSPAADLEQLSRAMASTATDTFATNAPNVASFSRSIGGSKQQHLTLLAPPREKFAVLDAAKVADVVLLVIKPPLGGVEDNDVGVDDLGYDMLKLIKAQGMPATVCLVQGLQGVQAASKKQQQALKRLCNRFYETEVDKACKVQAADNAFDLEQVFRWISEIKTKDLSLRENRSYLLAERASFSPSPASPAMAPTGSLRVVGFVRGHCPVRAKQLVHLTGAGDFQVSRIEVLQRARPRSRKGKDGRSEGRKQGGDVEMGMEGKRGDGGSGDKMAGEEWTLVEESVAPGAGGGGGLAATAGVRESLQDLQAVDEMANEQSIITEEEIASWDAKTKREGGLGVKKGRLRGGPVDPTKRAPGSLSSVQAIWDDILSDDDEEEAGVAGAGRQAMSDGVRSRRGSSKVEELEDEDEDEEEDELAGGPGFRVIDHDLTTLKGKRDAEQEQLTWPDEVEVPRDQPTKTRFQKYRGLKSFKHSVWDAFEELPLEYARIYQFENMAYTKKMLLQDEVGGFDPDGGRRVAITVEGVPAATAAAFAHSGKPMAFWFLHQHEHKISVLNFQVKRDNEYVEPVMGKEEMLFQCGFRRFLGNPIYSQLGKQSKFKTEKFFHLGDFRMASVYARVMFPPGPVLMFRPCTYVPLTEEDESGRGSTSRSTMEEGKEGRKVKLDTTEIALRMHIESNATPGIQPGNINDSSVFVAHGSLFSVDPNRLLIKRIVFTGHPINVHKKTAVIRRMFFSPDDIRWFKPVELWTKYGHVGHITEPRGTKGYMKCTFDGHIRQHDTVCMSMYKRQYPKWPTCFY